MTKLRKEQGYRVRGYGTNQLQRPGLLSKEYVTKISSQREPMKTLLITVTVLGTEA